MNDSIMGMKFILGIILLTYITLFGCQVYNSSTLDETKYVISTDVPTPATILQQHCGQCHDYGQRSFNNLVADGLIIPGSPMNSLLYTRIRGSGSGQNENMPQTSGSSKDLTAEELAILRDWMD